MASLAATMVAAADAAAIAACGLSCCSAAAAATMAAGSAADSANPHHTQRKAPQKFPGAFRQTNRTVHPHRPVCDIPRKHTGPKPKKSPPQDLQKALNISLAIQKQFLLTCLHRASYAAFFHAPSHVYSLPCLGLALLLPHWHLAVFGFLSA